MRRSRVLVCALILALLGGCGLWEGGPVPSPAAEDLTYELVGVRGDYAIVTVNGLPVTAEEYCFWLAGAVASYEGPLETEKDWEDASPGLKADALAAAKLYAVIRAKADELGVELTSEQEEQMAQEIARAAEERGGEEAFDGYLRRLGLTRAGFEALSRVYYLNEAVLAALEETGETAVTAEDLAEYMDGVKQDVYAAKHILIATRRENADGSGYEEYSDEEKAAALKKAQEILKEIRSGGDFDALMAQYSEDGRNMETGALLAPEGYPLLAKGEMPAEFETAALALKEGEVSDVVQTDYGYHIILRLPLDEAPLAAMAVETVTGQYKLDQLEAQWVEKAKVVTTRAYEDLDARKLWEALGEMAP